MDFWTSISAKIFWIAVVVGLMVGLLVGTIQIINEIRIERNSFEGTVHGVLETHSVSATNALLNNDAALTDLVITGMFAQSAVRGVEIKNSNGGIFAQKILEKSSETSGRIADYIFPHAADHGIELTVADQAEPVGELLIYFDANKMMKNFLSRVWLGILISVGGGLLLAASFGVLFYMIFGKPLVEATAQLRAKIDSGEPDLAVIVPRHHSNDELGLLLKTFNFVVASRAAADNELQFQKLAMDEHAIVSITDAEGKITYANDQFLEVSGYAREELLGNNHRILWSDRHTAKFYQNLWRCISGGKTWEGEIKYTKKNGSSYWVKETIIPEIGSDESAIRFISISTDISDTKAKEIEIRQFKATLDNIEDPVYMFWPDTLKFFYINQAAIDVAGKSAEQFAEMTPSDLNPNFDPAAFRKRCKPLVNGTENAITYDTEHLNGEGEQVPFEIRVQIIEPQGEKPRFVAIARDISERREIENAKSEFISTVSHELRTPLTSIKGAIGLVTGGATGDIPNDTTKILRLAYDNSVRLEKLINDIFDIEKAEAGLLELQIQPVDLVKLIHEATEEAKIIGDKLGVTFKLSGAQQHLLVNGDNDRLLQVMQQLLSNAAKFSSAGDEVIVKLSALGDTVQISVKDFGSGIPKDAQVTIFDKFTQQDSSDQRLKGGTGLGLSIAKAIVEAHGGSISITSDVGKGSTFFFNLHISDADTEFAA